MDKWINLTALWQIVVVGLLAGAGLPAVFALGVRAMSPAEVPVRAAGSGPVGVATAQPPTAVVSASRKTAGVLCFAVVAAAILYGLYLIVSST